MRDHTMMRSWAAHARPMGWYKLGRELAGSVANERRLCAWLALADAATRFLRDRAPVTA